MKKQQFEARRRLYDLFTNGSIAYVDYVLLLNELFAGEQARAECCKLRQGNAIMAKLLRVPLGSFKIPEKIYIDHCGRAQSGQST